MENTFLANSSALVLNETRPENDGELSAENLALADCVLRILDHTIEKLQIAVLIPGFLADQDLLKQFMGKTELRKCETLYNEYMSYAELIPEGDEKGKLHISLIELIDLFCENHGIRGILSQHLLKINARELELIEALKDLRNIMDVKLKTPAIIEMRREKTIHHIYQENEENVQTIAKLKKQLHDQEKNLRWKLAAKQALIKKYEDDLAAKKWENNLKVKQEILKSRHEMREFYIKSIARQEHLNQEVERVKDSYEDSLKSHAKSEKELRDEKNKLLFQLQALIRKYDQNIGDKIQENERLQKIYDQEKRSFDEFYIEYTEKEKEYNDLATKKRNEENAEFERKLFLFMSTRAATIIQRAWRRYLKAAKAAEKAAAKASKGKKKKKK